MATGLVTKCLGLPANVQLDENLTDDIAKACVQLDAERYEVLIIFPLTSGRAVEATVEATERVQGRTYHRREEIERDDENSNWYGTRYEDKHYVDTGVGYSVTDGLVVTGKTAEVVTPPSPGHQNLPDPFNAASAPESSRRPCNAIMVETFSSPANPGIPSRPHVFRSAYPTKDQPAYVTRYVYADTTFSTHGGTAGKVSVTSEEHTRLQQMAEYLERCCNDLDAAGYDVISITPVISARTASGHGWAATAWMFKAVAEAQGWQYRHSDEILDIAHRTQQKLDDSRVRDLRVSANMLLTFSGTRNRYLRGFIYAPTLSAAGWTRCQPLLDILEPFTETSP